VVSTARIGFALVVALAPLFASAAALDKGDVLLTDYDHARILRVAAGTGNVTVFSPRNDAQTNYLDGPFRIAIDPFGAAWVTDVRADTVVRIDPLTGSQSILQLCSNPFTCAAYEHQSPRSIEIRLAGSSMELWILSDVTGRALERVTISLVQPQSSATTLVANPVGPGGLGFLEGESGLDQVWYGGIGANHPIQAYDAVSGGAPSMIYQEVDPAWWLRDLEARRNEGGNLVAVLRTQCPNASVSGIYAIGLGPQALSVGGEFHCPEVFAVSPFPDPIVFWVVDQIPFEPRRLVRVREVEGEWIQDVVVPALPLAFDEIVHGLAVSPVTVPEPFAAPAALATLAAIAVAGRRRRAVRLELRAETRLPPAGRSGARGVAERGETTSTATTRPDPRARRAAPAARRPRRRRPRARRRRQWPS
jgi:hypothetical protein